MSNPPCKDCLVLVMCKDRAKKYYNETKYTHSNQRLIDNAILRLAYNCSILYTYCGIRGAYDVDVSSERVIMDGENALMVKCKKANTDKLYLIFNFPYEKGDDSVKSYM